MVDGWDGEGEGEGGGGLSSVWGERKRGKKEKGKRRKEKRRKFIFFLNVKKIGKGLIIILYFFLMKNVLRWVWYSKIYILGFFIKKIEF